MGELISIAWPSHAKHLCAGIWKSLEESYKTDFVISVSSKCGVQRLVKAHQLILSIFCSTIKNTDETILEFNQQSNVNEETIKFLLEFIYTGKMKIPIEKMRDLKTLAQTIGFEALVKSIESCVKYQEVCAVEKARKSKKVASVISVPKKCQDLFIPTDINVEMNDSAESADFKILVEDESNSVDREIEDDAEKELIEVACLAEKSEPTKFNEYCSRLRSKYKKKVDVPSPRVMKSEKVKPSKHEALFDRKTQTCKLCDKQFATKKHFELHIRSHLEPNAKVQCPHCDSKFFDASYLQSHVAIKHSVDMQGNPVEKKYKCKECEYSSVSLQRLSAHKIKHKEKGHKCDQCSYATYQSCDLKLHKEGVHSDLRPYVCETCGYRAKTMHSYRSHLNVHQEKVSCEECGAVFSARNIQRHKIRVHSKGEKEAKCHLCSYETSCRIYLGRHLRCVHNVQLSKRPPSLSQTPFPLQTQFEIDTL